MNIPRDNLITSAEQAKVQITFNVSWALREHLKAEAKREGKSFSAFLRDTLTRAHPVRR